MPTVDRIVEWALKNPPEKLFRYQPPKIKRVEMFLLRNKLYATSPKWFKDPLDTVVPLDTSGKRSEWVARLDKLIDEQAPNMPKAEREQRVAMALDSGLHIKMEEESKQALRDATGIVCLTDQEDNQFMWENYAKKGRGFCVCFDYSQADPVLGEAIPVQYLPEHPTYRYVDVNVRDVIVELMVTKLTKWKQEKEWRLVYLDTPDSFQGFTPTSLRAIVLGPKSSKNFVRRCKKMIKKRRYPTKIYKIIKNKNAKGTRMVLL